MQTSKRRSKRAMKSRLIHLALGVRGQNLVKQKSITCMTLARTLGRTYLFLQKSAELIDSETERILGNIMKTVRESFSRFSIARWAPIPLRLIVGYGFMQHGFAKLSKGPDAFAGILQAMGVPSAHLMAWLTILIELLGGLAVLVGAFVAIVSVPMVVVLLVAMFRVHLPNGFSSIKLLAVTPAGATFGPPGYEVNLLYIACLAALVMGGSGPLALDGLIRKAER